MKATKLKQINAPGTSGGDALAGVSLARSPKATAKNIPVVILKRVGTAEAEPA